MHCHARETGWKEQPRSGRSQWAGAREGKTKSAMGNTQAALCTPNADLEDVDRVPGLRLVRHLRTQGRKVMGCASLISGHR